MPPAFSRRRGGERDPYLFILVGQTALCLLLALIVVILREVKPVFWEPMTVWYEKTLTEMEPDGLFSETLSLESMIRQYGAWRDQAQEAVANAVEGLTADRTPASSDTESEPAGEEAVAEPEAMETFAFVGKGGMEEAPDSCTFAPVLLSSALESPVGGALTSAYGWRTHPITGKDDFHRGVDIAASQGSKLFAPLPGRVTEVGSSAIYGNFITLDHGNGLRTTYCHCETIVAREGEKLKKGELLATVGSTGVSTGPHAHFELSVNGTYYDPAWVMEGLREG